jgi:hypothetical protein
LLNTALHTALKRAPLILVACAAAWVAAGCAPSIAPGYTIEKQRIEVTYSKVAPDRVSVRAWYRLRNTGTQPLDELHFRLPFKSWAENLHAEWGGQAIAPHDVAGTGVEMSTHLTAPWNQRERKEFVLIFDLKIVNAKLSLGGDRGPFFFLPSGGWYPYLLPPPMTLAQGGTPPNKWDLVVSVPAGYRVHASGTQRGNDRSGDRNNGGSSNRFEQKLGTDFDPFVVSGPFEEQQAHSGSETVFLWSVKPLPESLAHNIGERLGEEAGYFTAEFGLKDITKGQVWRIGCPDGSAIGYDQPGLFRTLDPGMPWPGFVDCLTIPQSVVVPIELEDFDNPGEFLGPPHIDPARNMHRFSSVEPQLAATWFTFGVHQEPNGPLFPMSGTPDYMALAFNLSKNDSNRGVSIRELIHHFDSDPEATKETLGSAKNIEIARVRSELFFLALEDRCGAANVHHALARILRILRGKTWEVGDLRSAMEAECGADLADFFRQWLNRPGIPDEFRTRYMGAPAAKPAGQNN